MLGKPFIILSRRLCPPCSDGCLVEQKMRIVNGISCRKCTEFFPGEMILYKREFQYQGCKLWSLLNLMGYQTINIHIYNCLGWSRIMHVNIQLYAKSKNDAGQFTFVQNDQAKYYILANGHLSEICFEHHLYLKMTFSYSNKCTSHRGSPVLKDHPWETTCSILQLSSIFVDLQALKWPLNLHPCNHELVDGWRNE